nr:MFS transporter [uncultured Carboxylicivirga sp.]
MKRTGALIKPQSFPFYYGYIVLFFGSIGILASIPGQTIGISTFTDPVKDALGLSRDQFSFAYGIGTFISSLLLTYAGKLYDRYGVIWSATFSILILSASLVLSSYSQVVSEGIFSVFHFRHWAIPFTLMTILFAIIRFSGQGVLTMVSRNMVMKWFDRLRGRINSISSISVAFGFSISPLIIDSLIQNNGWQNAWRIMAASLMVVLVMVFLFYKDNPEKYGLQVDGKSSDKKRSKTSLTSERNFTLAEALNTRSFWMYALILSFHSFFVTGFTFHVVSIFSEAGYERSEAISIFFPITIVSTLISFAGNIISDWIKLKILLYIMILGAILSTIGLMILNSPVGYYLISIGFGMSSGLFAVLMSIVWPRFFGRLHLGAISGKAMSMLVLGSAVGPYLFSLSFNLTGQYGFVSYLALAFLIMLMIGSVKANPPIKQE